MTDLKRAIGLAEILHSDLQLSKAEQKEAGVMLRELAEEVEKPWPKYCGTSHCSCVQCVVPLSPHRKALLRQALEALESKWTCEQTMLIDEAITAIKEELK